jgi:hypothetical protein
MTKQPQAHREAGLFYRESSGPNKEPDKMSTALNTACHSPLVYMGILGVVLAAQTRDTEHASMLQ